MTVPSDTLLITLDTEAADIAGGLGIKPERCETHAFSIPDHVARTALLVPKGNPKQLNTYTEVIATGARLGCSPDRRRSRRPRRHHVPRRDHPVVASRRPRSAEPFTPPGTEPFVGAFAFRKEDTDLRERFDDALRELHDSGEWLDIARRFSFTDSNVPDPDLTTEQACQGR